MIHYRSGGFPLAGMASEYPHRVDDIGSWVTAGAASARDAAVLVRAAIAIIWPNYRIATAHGARVIGSPLVGDFSG
ncbi:hypothetical protein [Rosistilla oblonga]|uniref:hypothetical protein n=1 Tax=Rosistilla oblonga TaxID=2527990 RepID=UPI003A97ABE6